MSKMLSYVLEGMDNHKDSNDDYGFIVNKFYDAIRECDATPHDALLAAYYVYVSQHNINAMVDNKNMHIRPSELRKRKQKFQFVD